MTVTTGSMIPKRTKDLEESYTLQYGTPSLGTGNSLGWDSTSARVSVATERMVVVLEPSNETARRDDAGVGLLRWRQGVPCIGASTEDFQEYKRRLVDELFGEEEARIQTKIDKESGEGGSKAKKAAPKKAAASKEKNELARGRDGNSLKELVKQCIGTSSIKTMGVRGAVVVAQALDDTYWTGSSETPRVLGSAWSPELCGGDGGLGSMLGVCFDDGSLMLFSKSEMMTAFWVPEINLSRLHPELVRYVEAKKAKMLQDVVLPRAFVGVLWSEAVRVDDCTYSVIGGITENGALELYRVAHNRFAEAGALGGGPAPDPIQDRVKHVGTVRFDEEYITQATFAVAGASGASGDVELLVVCGCDRGTVHAGVLAARDLAGLAPVSAGSDGGHVNLLAERKITDHVLFQRDDRVVTSLAASVPNASSSSKMVVAVGKTMGTLQVFVGGDGSSMDAAIKAGKPADVPGGATIDKHSVAALAFLQDTEKMGQTGPGTGTRYLVVGSRLGNLSTLRLEDDVLEVAGNPVHHTVGGSNIQYAGFGCYGLATSPGGTFVAFCRQSQEPDREFRMQQQIHQMVTQGYLHFQSVVGTHAVAPSDGTDVASLENGTRAADQADRAEAAHDVAANGANGANGTTGVNGASGADGEALSRQEIDNKCSAMSEAMAEVVRTWAHGSSTAGPLWDAARMAALLETFASDDQMIAALDTIQRDAGVHGFEEGTWRLVDGGGSGDDPRARTTQYRFAAAMLHVLRALQGNYEKRIVKIDDWEMITMKGHLDSIINTPLPPKESDAFSGAMLTTMLAVDFIDAAHKSHSWIFPKSFADDAKRLNFWSQSGAGRPISLSALGPEYVAPIVTNVDETHGSCMDRALRATVTRTNSEDDPFDVIRCPATLLGNLDGGTWICSSCKRSYGTLPVNSTHFGFDKGVVACTLCASSKLSADSPYFS